MNYFGVEAMREALRRSESMVQRGGARGGGFDSLRYRILVTSLTRTQSYEEAVAVTELKRARRIRSGRRRHGKVKHWRDLLRRARRVS